MRNLHTYDIKYMLYKGDICEICIHFNGCLINNKNKGKGLFWSYIFKCLKSKIEMDKRYAIIILQLRKG
jgi:hypothetical protein